MCIRDRENIAYIMEDLRSPCTQEIAVFRAFAEIVNNADNEITVIDKAPNLYLIHIFYSESSRYFCPHSCHLQPLPL